MVTEIDYELLGKSQRLVLELDEKYTIDAAFWLLEPDTKRWRLYVVPARILVLGPLPVYLEFESMLRAATMVDWLSLDDVRVVEPYSVEVQTVRRHYYLAKGSNVTMGGTLEEGLNVGLLWTYPEPLRPSSSIRLKNADNSPSDYTLYFYNYTMSRATANVEDGTNVNPYGLSTFGVYNLRRLASNSGTEPPWNQLGIAISDPQRQATDIQITRFSDYVRLIWGAADYMKEGVINLREFKDAVESVSRRDLRLFGDY